MIDYGMERFAGRINSNNGFAHKNRFHLICNVPEFVLAEVGGGGDSIEDLDLYCSGAFMPAHRVLTHENDIISNPLKIPYSFSTEELAFTFNLSSEMKILKLFETWFQGIVNVNTYEVAYKKDIVVDFWEVWQLGKNNEQTKGVKLFNVMPISISSIGFDNSSGEVQNVSVSVSYDRREPL